MEYGFPSGHLGHLSDQEERKLRDFKKLVIQKGLYKPQTDEHEYGTHDDAMLLYVPSAVTQTRLHELIRCQAIPQSASIRYQWCFGAILGYGEVEGCESD